MIQVDVLGTKSFSVGGAVRLVALLLAKAGIQNAQVAIFDQGILAVRFSFERVELRHGFGT